MSKLSRMETGTGVATLRDIKDLRTDYERTCLCWSNVESPRVQPGTLTTLTLA
jgi:hypothetical protein